jgi:hypothetical protein
MRSWFRHHSRLRSGCDTLEPLMRMDSWGQAGSATRAPSLFVSPACRTPARCPPLRADEALDASQFGFVREIGHALAVFPLAHPLVVMASAVAVSHPMRIADEETADAPLLATGGRPGTTVQTGRSCARVANHSLSAGLVMGIYFSSTFIFSFLRRLHVLTC